MVINNICYIGEGYTGVPLCAVMAVNCPEIRFTVLENEKTVAEWNSNNLPLYEPDLEEILKKCRNRNLVFSSDYPAVIKEADIILISMNDFSTTYEGKKKSMDFKQLEDTARLITANSITDKIIVEKSTFSATATAKIDQIFSSLCIPGVNLELISCPEFLTTGPVVHNLLNPDRILIGVKNTPKSRAAAHTLKGVYERWIPSENIVIINIQSVEIAKLAANVFLAQKISSFNSLSQMCEASGTDISEITKICGNYTSIGPKYLQASLGLEGLNKDISDLVCLCESSKLIECAGYWQAVLDINNVQKKKFIEKVCSVLSPIADKQIGIWGFSCRKNTSDTRFSPAIEICSHLLIRGARIKIFDPKVPKQQILKDLETGIAKLGQKPEGEKIENVLVCDDLYKASDNTDAVILCTDWEEFLTAHFPKVVYFMKEPIFFDTKRALDPVVLSSGGAGIQLYSVGLNI